ncbi:terminase large subunit [Salmonella phage SPFM12]|nr:terminase large subunit [Salmonella phage SPFM12]
MNADMIANAPGTPDQIRRDFGGGIMFYVKYNHRQLGTTDEELVPTRAQLIDMIRKGSTAKIPREYMYSLMTSGISWDERYIDKGVPYGNVFATTPGDLATEEDHILPAALASGTAARRINEAGRGLTAGRLFSDEGPFTNNIQGNKLITGIGQNDKEAANGVDLWPHHPDDPDNRETFACLAPALREETINKMKQLRNALPDLLLWLMRFLENSRTILITKGHIDAAIEFLRQHGKTVGMSAYGMPFRLDRGNFSMYWIFFNTENPWYFFRECVRVPADGVKIDPFSPDLTLEQKAMIVTECGLGVQHWYVHLALHNPELRGAIVDDVTPNVHFLQFATTLQGWRYGDCMILRKNDWRHYPGGGYANAGAPHRVTNLPPPLRAGRFVSYSLDSSHSYGYA